MTPGGIGITRALPTPAFKSLLNYHSGDGPSHLKPEKFIRQCLALRAAGGQGSAIERPLHGRQHGVLGPVRTSRTVHRMWPDFGASRR